MADALHYMQLYPADYLADAAHLSTLEHGAYLLLIFNYWQRGESYKAKDARSMDQLLISITKLSKENFNQCKESLKEFFTVIYSNAGIEWKHKRIEVDLEKARKPSKRPSAEVWKIIRNKVFERDDYTCRYCGKRGVKLECDHVIPVSKGGSSDLFNLVTACFYCNRSKWAHSLEEWLNG